MADNVNKTEKPSGLSFKASLFLLIACPLLVITGAADKYSFITAKNGFGAFVSIAVLAVFLFLNVKMYKDNVQPEVKDVDKKRIEIAAKVKSGEINIDDLSMPIFETEEEREARLNALSGGVKKKKKDKKKKKGDLCPTCHKNLERFVEGIKNK